MQRVILSLIAMRFFYTIPCLISLSESYFMYILERLMAILLGITVLPLRVLAYNTLFALMALGIGIGAALGLPLIMASIFNKNGMPLLVNFLLTTLFVVPIIAVLTAVTLAAVATYLVYNTIMSVFESAWLGFKNGLLHGMEGFWGGLNAQRVYGQNAILQLRAFMVGVNAEALIDDADFDGFQRIVGELHDVVVVREDLEVPDLQGQGPTKLTALLSKTESQEIEELIKQLAEPDDSLLADANFLTILWTQYKDLSTKLEAVRTALEKGDKSLIEDDLITFNEVEVPILLVKEYKKGEQWHNVPAASYVTDRDSLLRWLKTNPRHPLNKDLLKTPEKFEKMETRYTWYELTQTNCSSQELVDAAVQIRVLRNKLLGLGSPTPSFFGANVAVGSNTISTSQERLSADIK